MRSREPPRPSSLIPGARLWRPEPSLFPGRKTPIAQTCPSRQEVTLQRAGMSRRAPGYVGANHAFRSPTRGWESFSTSQNAGSRKAEPAYQSVLDTRQPRDRAVRCRKTVSPSPYTRLAAFFRPAAFQLAVARTCLVVCRPAALSPPRPAVPPVRAPREYHKRPSHPVLGPVNATGRPGTPTGPPPPTPLRDIAETLAQAVVPPTLGNRWSSPWCFFLHDRCVGPLTKQMRGAAAVYHG